MTARRWPGRDRGSFTAELAAGLPALMLLLLAGLTAVNAVTTRAQCVDAAREGAIAAARGESGTAAAVHVAPSPSTVDVLTSGDTVTVTVAARVRLLGGGLPGFTVRASATAAREPDGLAAIP
ncbi:TadE family type IV pilus minor pilin [Krasilnikovia sp. M28-CT-15]|uniref:TadE family type IV pilus minor pilin n=1 Tax=Krasilnikovia sp. M28-CT-15 TaxID=3373540 RepID=UPI0038773D42